MLDDETGAVVALYERMLAGWNARDAAAFAAQYAEDGGAIGFDGSEHTGPATIEADMARIFADHPVARYVWHVRGVTFPTPDVAILRAATGLVPPGQSDINPATNALQTVIAVRRAGQWRILLLQNTPAQYHGRPELAEALTQELRQRL